MITQQRQAELVLLIQLLRGKHDKHDSVALIWRYDWSKCRTARFLLNVLPKQGNWVWHELLLVSSPGLWRISLNNTSNASTTRRACAWLMSFTANHPRLPNARAVMHPNAHLSGALKRLSSCCIRFQQGVFFSVHLPPSFARRSSCRLALACALKLPSAQLSSPPRCNYFIARQD